MEEEEYINQLHKYIKDNFLFMQDCVENKNFYKLSLFTKSVSDFFDQIYALICRDDFIIKTQGHLGDIENKSMLSLLKTRPSLKYMLCGSITIDLINGYEKIKNNEEITKTFLFEKGYIRVIYTCKYCRQNSMLKIDNKNKQLIFEENVTNCIN